MGRMLVQMLGMFAQFERDTIIDRIINGMERKAAKGLWKGGRRPFGYLPDTATQTLTPHPGESPIVALIYRSYTRDRLGSKVIARTLNERGHRTTNGGTWSGYQVLRTLSTSGNSPSGTSRSRTAILRSWTPTPTPKPPGS